MEFNDEYDTQNYRQVLVDFAEQIQKSIHLGDHVILENTDIDAIAILGIGGSGIPGRILKDYLRDEKFPIHLITDNHIPEYITKNTLVFVLSYSGNTDETIETYRRIARKNCQCVCISSGGKLEQITPMYNNFFIKIPDGLQPRVATGYLFTPVLLTLIRNSIISNRAKELKNTITTLGKDVYEAYAKELVEKIGDKIPLIYASKKNSAVAYKWKIAINETAKRPAFSNVLPEAFHNEIEAQSDKIFTIIIKDLEDDSKTKSRMDSLRQVIRDGGNEALEIVVRGEDSLSKAFSTMHLGDWVSYYLALSAGVDPTPIPIIESFKKKP